MKHFRLLVLAFVIAAGAIATFAFTPKKIAPVKAKTQVHWVFLGSTMAEAFDAGNYEINESAPGCSVGSNVPCSIYADEDPVAFQEYLDSFGEDGNALKLAAESVRP